MRKWVLLALCLLFYFTSFPSLTLTDLTIISFLAIVGITLAAKTLLRLTTSLVEEAFDAKIDSFISRSWAKYRNYGFNRHMTYRLAKCFIIIVCVKYGFDVIKHAAEHVPSVQARAYWAEIAGAMVVLFFILKEAMWMRMASNFRRDMQKKERLSMGIFHRLYSRPIAACCVVLYAPTLLKGTVAAVVQLIIFLAPESSLFAAPAAQCTVP